MPAFVDTNVLLYSISDAPADAAKCIRACAILDHEDCALSVQVLQEFFVQATRVSRPDPLARGIAAALMRAWSRFPIQDMTLALLNRALEIQAAHRLSYWDSAIVAAAEALGCAVLYSEDLSDGQTIGGVTVVNPFR